MSAPDPQVRVVETLAGWSAYCGGGCHWSSGPYSRENTARRTATSHLIDCPAIALACLQARWDARDEVLHTLIERWRGEAGRIGAGRMATSYAAGRIDCADELERAIGGGRG